MASMEESLSASVCEKHAEVYARGASQIVPSFLIETREGDLQIVQTPWRDDDEKSATFAALRTLMRAVDAVRYVHWSAV